MEHALVHLVPLLHSPCQHAMSHTQKKCVCREVISPVDVTSFVMSSCYVTHTHTQCTCREVVTPVDVGPYKVPTGTIVWPMQYALHNSIHNWDQPMEFRPER